MASGQAQAPKITMTPAAQPDGPSSRPVRLQQQQQQQQQPPPRLPGVTAAGIHPRRPPANRSVSLLHPPLRKAVPKAALPNERSDSSSDSGPPEKSHGEAQSSESASSLQPLARDSSGESSNADKWFEKSNNAVRDNSTSFVDNEPPFFLRNSSSSQTPPERQNPPQPFAAADDGASSLPLRTDLLRLGTDGSSTDDFRGVIDDLTVENKKLRRRLKKYEKLHDAHLKDEKLFEVRIHTLPPEKKRELEETLRKFASSLGTPGGSRGGSGAGVSVPGFPAHGHEGLPALFNSHAHKASSSQASLQHADSAYASASGQGGSSVPSGNDTIYPFNVSTAARRQNVNVYLRHVPEGLLPQSNTALMSERAKKKLVVRRLEQIFSGKVGTAAGHQQYMQQQEVSQTAAHADSTALEAQGEQPGQEGSREAHIMLQEGDDQKQESPDERHGPFKVPAPVKGGEPSGLSERSPPLPAPAAPAPPVSQSDVEQRPTRPLDLDPHRAQVPAENIRYMRHLGFSPPDPGDRAEDGHGWIYLNILVNMAQLHTINVTIDFVRKALSDYSDRFELSPDGRKVRWKGARLGARPGALTSSSSGGHSNERASDDVADSCSPRKRMKLSHWKSSLSTGPSTRHGDATQRALTENHRLVYTPMFFHKDSTDEADESSSVEEDDALSTPPLPAQAAGHSTGLTSAGIRTASARKNKTKNDGPIIFYNNARFCTDLSGERRLQGNPNPPPYNTIASDPIGKPPAADDARREKRGPLAEAADLPEPMDLVDNPIPESMELTFPPSSPMKSSPGKSPSPVDFEVTGIGGVWPTDNFSINIESRHGRVDPDGAHEAASRPIVGQKTLPPKLAGLLHGHDTTKDHPVRGPVREQVLSSHRHDLPPSQLPPALSFMPFDDDSPDDDASDDDMSISPASPGALPPSAALQAMDLPYAATVEGDAYGEAGGASDEESESSLDLLAAARQLDPDTIHEHEREYDAITAERLGEEIPAGSSAATAGGGSGFSSPASQVSSSSAEEEAWAPGDGPPHRRPPPRPGLTRARRSDSMEAQGVGGSSGGESEDESGVQETSDSRS